MGTPLPWSPPHTQSESCYKRCWLHAHRAAAAAGCRVGGLHSPRPAAAAAAPAAVCRRQARAGGAAWSQPYHRQPERRRLVRWKARPSFPLAVLVTTPPHVAPCRAAFLCTALHTATSASPPALLACPSATTSPLALGAHMPQGLTCPGGDYSSGLLYSICSPTPPQGLV